MTTNISPAKLLEDDFSGDWSEDIGDVFRTINKFSTDTSGALSQQVLLSSLGAQKVQLQSVSIPPLWTAPTLATGVTDLGGADQVSGYYKDDYGIVHIRGTVVRATVGTIFTLPTGFRPALNRIFSTWVSTAGTEHSARLAVTSAGVVSIATFAPSTWGSIECEFDCSDVSPGIPTCFPIRIRSQLKTGTASSVLLGSAVDVNNNGGQVISLGHYNVSWHNETGFDGTTPVNFVVIDNIIGLIPTHTYSIALWALPNQ